jgi:hypothetical protein
MRMLRGTRYLALFAAVGPMHGHAQMPPEGAPSPAAAAHGATPEKRAPADPKALQEPSPKGSETNPRGIRFYPWLMVPEDPPTIPRQPFTPPAAPQPSPGKDFPANPGKPAESSQP